MAASDIAFSSTVLDNSRYGVTSVDFGPDGNIYSADVLGNIVVYNIDDDTGRSTSKKTLTKLSGAQIIGTKFDPDDDDTLWVSYATRGERHSGTISKIDINTGKETKVITGLPNPAEVEHQVNGIDFGPDGKLYIAMGGLRSLGGEGTWTEPETPLSAAILVADVNSSAFSNGPVDVTAEADGSGYNPYANNAPVQIYATGVRNGYDIEWVQVGNKWYLVGGINQSDAARGSALTPDDPSTSANEEIWTSPEHESIVIYEEGKYYGHPNPSRGEYITNGGNPTSGKDPYEVTEYPVGTQPEPNFAPENMLNVIDLFDGQSVNGIDTWVDGSFVVVNFNGPSTTEGVYSLSIDSRGDLEYEGRLEKPSGTLFIPSPLDITVDEATGRIYVANFGKAQHDPSQGGLYLLDPQGDVPIDDDPVDDTPPDDDGGSSGGDDDSILIQAEDLVPLGSGYVVETRSSATNNKVAGLFGGDDTGEIDVDFRGNAGIYDIVIGYIDENDGQSPFRVEIGSQTWNFVADDDPAPEAVRTYTINDVALGAGNKIKIYGTRDEEEYARLDYVALVKENTAPTLAAGTLGAVEDGPTVTLDLAALGGDADADDDGSTLSYAVTGQPAEGAAAISGTILTFDPGSAFQDLNDTETRSVTVEITATDSHGATAVGDVSVTVTGRNDTDPSLPPVTEIHGSDDSDVLEGTGVSEIFYSGAGTPDRLTGGPGDVADYFFFGAETANGVEDRDIILDFQWQYDALVLGEGVAVNRMSDTTTDRVGLRFGGDDDALTLYGDGLTADNLTILTYAEYTGSDGGNDGDGTLTALYGTDDADRMTGTTASEAFYSGAGTPDWLQGGAGDVADYFVFGPETTNGVEERDIISDFQWQYDALVLADGVTIDRMSGTTVDKVGLRFEGDNDALTIYGDGLTMDNLTLLSMDEAGLA